MPQFAVDLDFARTVKDTQRELGIKKAMCSELSAKQVLPIFQRVDLSMWVSHNDNRLSPSHRLTEQATRHETDLEACRIAGLSTEQELARTKRELVAARKEGLRLDDCDTRANGLAAQLKQAIKTAHDAMQRCSDLELNVQEVQQIMEQNQRQRAEIELLEGELLQYSEDQRLGEEGSSGATAEALRRQEEKHRGEIEGLKRSVYRLRLELDQVRGTPEEGAEQCHAAYAGNLLPRSCVVQRQWEAPARRGPSLEEYAQRKSVSLKALHLVRR